MKLKHYLVDFWDKLILIRKKLVKRIDRAILLVLFVGFALSIYQIAFPKEGQVASTVLAILRKIPWLAMTLYLVKWFLQHFIRKSPKMFDRRQLPDLTFAGLLFLYEKLKYHVEFLYSDWFLYVLLSVFFVVRIIREGHIIKDRRLTPSMLFGFSFAMLIFVSTALLLIPDVTTHQMTFVDALFTATSAVCVTGLAVVDTASAFTPLGKDMLLVMIQIGGLGLMTFTNFFAVLFRGGMSFRNHLILNDIIQPDQPNSLVSTLVKIVGYTLIMEAIGVFLIHYVSNEKFFTNSYDSWFFSVFHAVSAFCNAGFSTLPDGLFNGGFRYNYPFQIIICLLVIFGGIGFPVVIDLYNTVRSLFRSLFQWLFMRQRFVFLARNLNVHSRLVLTSTTILLVLGMILYFATEYNNTLQDHPTIFGKFTQSLFGSVTPRTAGFNTVDMGGLMQGTILVYLLLMWIGASPSSTGGGIKTTTFTIAISNIVALVRGKGRVELFKREISEDSIKRAFAVMFISFLIIGLAVFLISIFEPEQQLTKIAFECFSAYSTVGLSLNLTPELSTPSKFVLIVTMFLGRVGMFTILFGLFKKVGSSSHRYPKENVLIV
ncbi:TrkH family potassium uptake protein [Jiulongibacter sediminis]|uniref:TrkH family potassium uptake protein n=1 Tax=Jiulongibacter sediminis TaxID=1605367 RepID=UPI0006DC0210|nr:potassium transporter TrkG [Jiulongibacter sediminis]